MKVPQVKKYNTAFAVSEKKQQLKNHCNTFAINLLSVTAMKRINRFTPLDFLYIELINQPR